MTDTKSVLMRNHQLTSIRLICYQREIRYYDSGTLIISKCADYLLWVKRAGLKKQKVIGTTLLEEHPIPHSQIWNYFTREEMFRLYPPISSTFYTLTNGCNKATLVLELSPKRQSLGKWLREKLNVLLYRKKMGLGWN